jgi:hypothetical protein
LGKLAKAEAQLAGDEGETAKLLKQLKAAQTRARRAERAANTNPATILKADLNLLRKALHPDGHTAERQPLMTRAMQIFNDLKLSVRDDA